MDNHLAFSAFHPIAALSSFVSFERNISAYQRHPHCKRSPRCSPSSARIVTMTTSLNQNKGTIPDAVRDANAVIVGGGPTGLLAAILMAHRNIPVTVIEQDDNLNRFDPMKAYALSITNHGLGALKQLPSLLNAVKERGIPFQTMRRINIRSDGTRLALGHGMSFKGCGTPILHTRVSLVEALQSYSKKFPNITLLKQTRVTDVAYDEYGEMNVSLTCAEKQYSIRTKLLLACDGKNSIVRETLRKSAHNNSNVLQSSQGLGEDSMPTLSTGKLVKSIAIQEEFVANKLTSEEDTVNEVICVHQLLPKNGVASDKAFMFAIFPMSSEMSNRCGGRIATSVQSAESELWWLKTVDEGYQLFEDVLPQLEARTYIMAENMKKFVEAKALRLPVSTRLESLVVHVGSATRSGGVVFLGDAAHSFPPDVGQGANSAFEDVQVLMNVLDTFGTDGTIEEFIEQYEMERSKDVEGLLEYVRRSTGLGTDRLSSQGCRLHGAW